MDHRLTCDHCGHRFKLSAKPSGGVVRCPACRKRVSLADDQEEERHSIDRPRKRRSRVGRRKSRGAVGALFATLVANLPFLLTRVLPVVVVLAVMVGAAVYFERRRWLNKTLEQLADRLWAESANAVARPTLAPYLRGEVAVLETQSKVKVDHQNPNKPQHWVNRTILPPLREPESIGSIILVEWRVFEDVVRDGAGRAMTVGSRPGRPAGDNDPVMLKRWDCTVKLVDLRRKAVLYEARLSAPDRTFAEGEAVIVTPSTSVTEEQLAAEFDKIRAFPRIDLGADPPEEQYANDLWARAGGATAEPAGPPYVRGRLAVLETQSLVKTDFQDAGKPKHWVNRAIAPPDDASSVGSVILVEWHVSEEIARSPAGYQVTAPRRGGLRASDNYLRLRRWDCRLKLIDLKQGKVLYKASLSAPDRTFDDKHPVPAFPTTVVAAPQLAAEFEKIRAFPQVPLDGEPPGASPQ